jgi:hypothetical protein
MAQAPLNALTESKNEQGATSWHPSGKFLVFEETTPETNVDLMILPMDGDDASGWRAGTPMVFLNSPFIEGGRCSRRMAVDCVCLAGVRTERSVCAVLPKPGGKWQISTGGGNLPTWSRTKRELFYGLNGQIMVAGFAVEGDSFRPNRHGLVRGTLSDTRVEPDVRPAPRWRAVRGRARGAIGRWRKADKAVFIVNFFDELRRIVPAPNDERKPGSALLTPNGHEPDVRPGRSDLRGYGFDNFSI